MTICLFNFEHTFYKENNHKSMHLGHPFVDLKEAHKDDVIKKYELNAKKNIYLFCLKQTIRNKKYDANISRCNEGYKENK